MKYHEFHRLNDLYWGIGIENETYVVLNSVLTSGSYIATHHNPEPSRIDYEQSYQKLAFTKLGNDVYEVPFYINSYSLRGDFHREFMSQNPDLEWDDAFSYDGDHIEFTTQNFYKTTVGDAIKELLDLKRQFIQCLNASL